jgi:uncharacterized damage-inducible protein DinB
MIASMPNKRASAFLATYRDEVARTKRVLAAFPAGKEDIRPDPEGPRARDAAWKLVLGQGLMVKAMGGLDWSKPPGKQPESPANFAEIAKELDAGLERVERTLGGMDDAALEQTVQFPVGPGKFGDFRKIDFCWFLLHDHIHHRGQLSVYIRLAGGKVPSIYGPSGDERWF